MAKFEYLESASATGLLRLADVARVSDSLRGGGLAVLPTETGYMLAALATSTEAILAAFRVKGRDLANTMHVACSSIEMAADVSVMTPRAMRLLGGLTPGPMTVVVRQTDRLPRSLVTLNATVGIRVPDHPATLQVIAALGAPVTATSLNRAGEPPGPIERASLESLDWPSDGTVYVVEDDDSIVHSLPSTLVRVTDATLEILRAGPIGPEEVKAVAGAPTHDDEAGSARSVVARPNA